MPRSQLRLTDGLRTTVVAISAAMLLGSLNAFSQARSPLAADAPAATTPGPTRIVPRPWIAAAQRAPARPSTAGAPSQDIHRGPAAIRESWA